MFQKLCSKYKQYVIFIKCHICVLTEWTRILINNEKGRVIANHSCLCKEADPTPCIFPLPPLESQSNIHKGGGRPSGTMRFLQVSRLWKGTTVVGKWAWRGGEVQSQQAGEQAAGGENVPFWVDMGRP